MKTVLRQEREKRGWTQRYVAEKIGITQQSVQQLELNQTKPSYEVLVKLLNLFGYNDPRQLFAVVDDKVREEERY